MPEEFWTDELTELIFQWEELLYLLRDRLDEKQRRRIHRTITFLKELKELQSTIATAHAATFTGGHDHGQG